MIIRKGCGKNCLPKSKCHITTCLENLKRGRKYSFRTAGLGTKNRMSGTPECGTVGIMT
jgi:hypothetical protein